MCHEQPKVARGYPLIGLPTRRRMVALKIVEDAMSSFLIHIHTGPESPTKAALGLLVAVTATKKGHSVNLFLAGDAVHLLSPDHADVTGQGTGRVGDHLAALREAGASFKLSGMSAKARGYDETLLDGYQATFAMPDVLVDLADGADTVLCY